MGGSKVVQSLVTKQCPLLKVVAQQKIVQTLKKLLPGRVWTGSLNTPLSENRQGLWAFPFMFHCTSGSEWPMGLR